MCVNFASKVLEDTPSDAYVPISTASGERPLFPPSTASPFTSLHRSRGGRLNDPLGFIHSIQPLNLASATVV